MVGEAIDARTLLEEEVGDIQRSFFWSLEILESLRGFCWCILQHQIGRTDVELLVWLLPGYGGLLLLRLDGKFALSQVTERWDFSDLIIIRLFRGGRCDLKDLPVGAATQTSIGLLKGAAGSDGQELGHRWGLVLLIIGSKRLLLAWWKLNLGLFHKYYNSNYFQLISLVLSKIEKINFIIILMNFFITMKNLIHMVVR